MDFRVFVEPQQGATYADQLAVAQDRGGGRLLRVLPFRSLPGDGRRRTARPDRLLGDAGGHRPRDVDDQAGHHGHLRHVPPPGRAGDLRRPGRRDERWPCRSGHRRRLVRSRARRIRDPVPTARRAFRPPRRAVGHPHRAVDHAGRRDLRLRGQALHRQELAGAAEAHPVPAPADHHRRRRPQADARPDGEVRGRVQHPVRRPRHPQGPVRRGSPRPWPTRAAHPIR